PIPVSAVKDLILHDDPFIAAITTNGTDIQKVVHLGRGLNTHQRTAIEAMGLRCSNIACNQTIALQIDHRDPWTTNNQTVLDNQDPLCPKCHNHKTHHGWNLEPGKGPRKFLPPETANQTSGNDPVPTSNEVPVGTTTDDQLQFC
ncbi:MAG: HNH endonuclease, partial [Acidimicrobiales bacterium]|nr:HNH endonuclease [Acidimicrobiales bacterium]